MTEIRHAAVAGQFYPSDPDELAEAVMRHLSHAQPGDLAPKALIAPHAGFIYSGDIAATAYRQLDAKRDRIDRVVLLGPSHRVAFRGLAVCSAQIYETPLGDVRIDTDQMDRLRELPQISVIDQAHAFEHSLEVQLPFLQMLLSDFRLLPVVVGDASAAEVAEVLELLWGGDETLIVISSDLSHYHDYDTARSIDNQTTALIHSLDAAELSGEQACGCRPINGLLQAARRHGMHAHVLDVRSSGDTAGPRDQVVGYGAYAFT